MVTSALRSGSSGAAAIAAAPPSEMADQKLRRHALIREPARRRPRYRRQIRGKPGIGELALGMTQPRKVEAQHGDTECGQAVRGNASWRRAISFRTGEAMRKQRGGPNRPFREVEPRRKRRLGMALKRDFADCAWSPLRIVVTSPIHFAIACDDVTWPFGYHRELAGAGMPDYLKVRQ